MRCVVELSLDGFFAATQIAVATMVIAWCGSGNSASLFFRHSMASADHHHGMGPGVISPPIGIDRPPGWVTVAVDGVSIIEDCTVELSRWS